MPFLFRPGGVVGVVNNHAKPATSEPVAFLSRVDQTVLLILAGGVVGVVNNYANLRHISNSITLWLGISPPDLFFYAVGPVCKFVMLLAARVGVVCPAVGVC